MVRDDDPRLTEARAIPIDEVADRLAIAGLKRAGRELIGPCPACGGKDRFGINVQKGVYNCRHCGAGDGLKLVQLVLGCDFRAAVAWLMGAEVSIDPAEAARREAKRKADKARSEERAGRERAKAVARAKAIWDEGRHASRSPVSDYLERRGLPPPITGNPPDCLRFHPALPYMVDGDQPGQYVEIHRGPAMLAGVLAPSGALTAVHRTWLDLDQPKGKARILHKGEEMEAKKIWGHKKGCAIRLSHEFDRDFTTLVMGEGIETTLTAMAADAYPDAAYWAGIDLGNMAGSRVLRGEGMKYAGIPDLDDAEAFLPPPWVKHLIFIQDGDSEPRLTRAKLESGLRRARAKVPGLTQISIAHAGAGRDLNDVLMGVGE
jgi:hypothetical protein